MASENILQLNAQVMDRELQWFAKLLDWRESLNKEGKGITFPKPPEYDNDLTNTPYMQFVEGFGVSFYERVIILLALIPHINPDLLDIFFTINTKYNRSFTEFGGIENKHHKGFIPTGETVMFLLAPNDLALRFRLMEVFSKDHPFSMHNIVSLKPVSDGPELSGELKISTKYLSLLTTGVPVKPEYSTDFPAKIITTAMNWEDVVLNDSTLKAVQEINIWLQHGQDLLKDDIIGRKIKRGYRSLFYGPSGTGKTLTASLLGKSSGLDVYRIDLSMIVSKYIGETEKNLSRIFDQAENRNWILFFDEADALFGKRTQTSSSNDRHANKEVSYLLQRIEDFSGVVILASNYKSNMDPAFMRRFQSIIRFPMPSPGLRMTLYKQAFTGRYTLDEAIDLHDISDKYELSGGNIANVLRYCAMMAMHHNEQYITEGNFYEGIRTELKKIGKTM